MASKEEESEAAQTCFATVLRWIDCGLRMLLMFKSGIVCGVGGCLDVFL